MCPHLSTDSRARFTTRASAALYGHQPMMYLLYDQSAVLGRIAAGCCIVPEGCQSGLWNVINMNFGQPMKSSVSVSPKDALLAREKTSLHACQQGVSLTLLQTSIHRPELSANGKGPELKSQEKFWVWDHTIIAILQAP